MRVCFVVEIMLIKQLINFFVGRCGEYEIFFVILQRENNSQITNHNSQRATRVCTDLGF